MLACIFVYDVLKVFNGYIVSFGLPFALYHQKAMARIDHKSIKDLLLNKSSISDYRIYEKDGNMVVHKLYIPDAEQLKTGERYKDVRANNKEFAMCSAISSSVLATLPSNLLYFKKLYLQGTLTGLLKKIKLCNN